MLARISFESGQKVSVSELKKLSDFLSDDVGHSEQVIVDGELTTYYNWNHTFDPKEAEEGSKKLAIKSDYVDLISSKEYFTDVNLFIREFPKLAIKLRGTVKTSRESMDDMITKMVEIEDKFTSALKQFDKKIEFNQKCDVHVPNLGLININQVGYANDKCTEELQGLLNTGWRILAVCPQPDQRRPDYILGRYNENAEELSWCQF